MEPVKQSVERSVKLSVKQASAAAAAAGECVFSMCIVDGTAFLNIAMPTAAKGE